MALSGVTCLLFSGLVPAAQASGSGGLGSSMWYRYAHYLTGGGWEGHTNYTTTYNGVRYYGYCASRDDLHGPGDREGVRYSAPVAVNSVDGVYRRAGGSLGQIRAGSQEAKKIAYVLSKYGRTGDRVIAAVVKTAMYMIYGHWDDHYARKLIPANIQAQARKYAQEAADYGTVNWSVPRPDMRRVPGKVGQIGFVDDLGVSDAGKTKWYPGASLKIEVTSNNAVFPGDGHNQPSREFFSGDHPNSAQIKRTGWGQISLKVTASNIPDNQLRRVTAGNYRQPLFFANPTRSGSTGVKEPENRKEKPHSCVLSS